MVVAILALATLAVFPGPAAAQSPPPPTVGGAVITQAPVVQGEVLPRTGSDLFPTVVAAVGLVLIGTILVVSVRRRRSGPTLA